MAPPPDETRPPAGAARLFHTIVVVGASLGCGGGGEVRPQPVADASTPASFGGDDANGAPDVTTARADGAPTGICDCARPGTFRCRACASGKSPIRGRCIDGDGVGCECDASVAIAAPGDCPHPEQFVCNVSPDYSSTNLGSGVSNASWYAFADCSCDPTLPLLPSDCDCEQCTFTCAEYDPCSASTAGVDADRVRYACTCLPPVTPIR